MNDYIKILKNNYNIEKIDKLIFGDYNKRIDDFKYLKLNTDKKYLYIFDETSYLYFLTLHKHNNKSKDIIINFLDNANYIVFYSELFENNKLKTYGSDFALNYTFAKVFFKNAKHAYISNTRNIELLAENNIIDNITYFPTYGYSDIANINPIQNSNIKNIDILIYGNINPQNKYRNEIINEVKNFCKLKNLNIVVTDQLYDNKDEILSKTKIVLHVPSHPKLHTFPWAKVTELMAKKIFFIIEENDEMYIKKLDKDMVYYKQGNMNDLKEKLLNYLNSESKRNEKVEKNYNYVKNNFNMDNLLLNI